MNIAYLAAGLLYAAMAVFAYRMGLRDGMRKERGVEPVLGKTGRQRAPESKEDKAARELNSRVDNFKG